MDSIFLGGILSISSTTIIIKAFDELGLKTKRFAEIVFGVLIVEDLVAILLLVALSTVAVTKTFFSFEPSRARRSARSRGRQLVSVRLLFRPRLLRSVGKYLTNETLTVLSAGLCLLLVVVATSFSLLRRLSALSSWARFSPRRTKSAASKS